MILPSKHISQNRALFTIGANILKQLSSPMTVSALWETINKNDEIKNTSIHYNTFVLTLDMLFTIGAIDLDRGLLFRSKQ